MLKIEHLSVSYAGGQTALSDFTLHMRPGEIVALVGESGSGKTTAVRTIMGLLPPGGKVTGGNICFEGNPLLDLSAKEFSALRGKDLSMIFQDSGAMMNPIRTIGAQFREYIRVHSTLTHR